MPRIKIVNRPVIAKFKRAFCDCGQPATVMQGNAYICERCARLESRRPLERHSTPKSHQLLGAPAEFYNCNLRSISTKS